jgi:signal transduction histidine kinase
VALPLWLTGEPVDESRPKGLHTPNLRTRLAIALAFPVVLALLISALGVYAIHGILLRELRSAEANSSLLTLVERFHGEAEHIIGSLQAAVLTDDAVLLQDYHEARIRIRAVGDELEARLKTAGFSQAEVEYEEALRAGRVFIEKSEASMSLKRDLKMSQPQFYDFLVREVRPARRQAQASLDALRDAIQNVYRDAQGTTLRKERLSLYLVLTLIAAALLSLLYLAWKISRHYLALNDQAQLAIRQKEASVELLSKSNRELESLAADLRQRERSLAETSLELKRSNEALDQFASIAAHDLSEPLRTVSLHLSMLERKAKEKLGSEERQNLTLATSASVRMSQLLKSLLSYSRLVAQSEPTQTVSAEKALAQASDNLKLALTESGALLTHDPLPDVEAEPSHLCQIFQNLISNAIKYHGDDAPRIHVGCRERGEMRELFVEDNGRGFDPSQGERIFRLFYRLKENEAPGTGIGLSVCRRLVERFGGTMWAESAPGRGAKFFFTLPAAKSGSSGLPDFDSPPIRIRHDRSRSPRA